MTPRMILGAILAAGALFAGPAMAQAPVLSEAGAKQAASNYERYCSLCHGRDREGHVNDHAPSLRSQSLLESDPGIIGEAICCSMMPSSPRRALRKGLSAWRAMSWRLQ